MHRLCRGCCLVLWLGLAPFVSADTASQGKVVYETWDTAYLEGARAGSVHTLVREVDRDGEKRFRTTVELELRVRRFGDLSVARMQTGSEETPEGKVTAVFMRQSLGKGQQLVMDGVVKEGQLHLTIDQPNLQRRFERRIPWNDDVVGLYRQLRLFQEKKAKPGDQFRYAVYEPTVASVVTTQVVVKGEEEVEVLEAPRAGQRPGQSGKTRRRLLRVEATPDKIEVPGVSLQLPSQISWLDEDLLPVRSQTEIPGLGVVNFYRTTREGALRQDGPAAALRDLGLSTLIPLNRPIPRPHEARAVLYRVTLQGDKEPATAFKQDERQKVKLAEDQTVEIEVRAPRTPAPLKSSEEPGEEFLKSSLYINCDDDRVQALARQAVGRETDPWRQAQRIERWVHDNLRNKNFTEAFATADQVARSLEGDCTEHAVLTAAMCRAVGIPSRGALGLVYVNTSRGPHMGFHMWTEVWVKGQWLGIDATLGLGGTGAGHLKVTDHSWHNVESLTPLLPVVRVVGKVAIEVLHVEGAD